ncbi:MAG: nitrogen regulation protein NR(II) [Gammaproteobacteria bacterium]|nr:nitrogen regulation protein NR(II) [Gammaproteobacteria bacterium]
MNDYSTNQLCDPETMLDNISTAVLVLNEELEVACLNPAAENLFFISERKAVGQPLQHLISTPNTLVQRLQAALKSDHPYTDRSVFIQLGNGRKATINYTATPYRADNGLTYLLMELSRIDLQIRIANEETLLAQQQASAILVRGLAHEIKNPLGGLRGAAQLLERELPSRELREYTQIIIGEADRLQNLMDRMLGPHKRPNMETINIHEITERVRQLMQAAHDQYPKIQIKTDYDPSIPTLLADRDRLIQALLNIGNNAMQAIGRKAGNISITTRTLRRFTIGQACHRLVVQVQIRDDGPGVPAEMLPNIFYPMITGRSDGSGLGLSIAQSLVNLHHGLIECHSQPRNTVFSILLPLETEHE